MSDTWDEYAGEWDTTPDAIAYAEKAFQCLANVARIEGRAVFDFGCGTGLLTERIAPFAEFVVALDTSQKMIDVLAAKDLPNVASIRGTVVEWLSSESRRHADRFDLVVASSVCAFVPDYVETLRQLRSILRAGGTYVQWDWLSSGETSGPGFTEAQVFDALKEAGFRRIAVSTAFSMAHPDGHAPVLMAVASN